MKSTTKIKQYAVEMVKAKADSKFKQETCQFSRSVNGGGKHCSLTTNKSCGGCTFYDPTIGAVLEALAEEIKRAQDAKKRLDDNCAFLKKMVDRANSMNAYMDHLIEESEREYSQIYIAKYDMTQLWQDSINSYE